MTIENFSKIIVRSNIINTYVATAFFSVLIYFTINANLYTPLEIITGVIFITIAFKGIANLMFSLIVMLYNLENKKDALEFDLVKTRVDGLISDLALKESNLKSANNS